jgi:hypothetical protein
MTVYYSGNQFKRKSFSEKFDELMEDPIFGVITIGLMAIGLCMFALIISVIFS